MLNKADNFFLLAGPCAIEGEDMAMRIAEKIVKITQKLDSPPPYHQQYQR